MKDPGTLFVQAISPYHRLLVCIKGSPDPDALASAFVCKLLCERLGKKCRIVATQALALQQNRVFAKRLALPFELAKDFSMAARWADAYLVFDHASPVVEHVSDKLPCAAHIDHHEPVQPPFPIDLRLCRTDVGSTSTLVAQILQTLHPDLRFSRSDMSRMTTALMFGLQTDTDHYALAVEPDFAAIEFLTGFANDKVLKKLSAVPLSRTTRSRLAKAEGSQVLYKDWLIASVGFVPEKSRDDIAIIADLLLRREKPALVVVFALVRNDRTKKLTLDASFRSADPKLKLSHLIRSISTDGGGRKFKGAFQVKLDYFASFSEADALWALVEKATLEKLKRTRDGHYKVRLQGWIEGARETASRILRAPTGGAR